MPTYSEAWRAPHAGTCRLAGLVLLAAGMLADPRGARGSILGCTNYTVDLTQPKAAGLKVRWSDPKQFLLKADGLGWGKAAREGSRDFWLETREPIGLGVSWRPTTFVSIRASIDGPGTLGTLYVRYSADARHWSTWQVVPEEAPHKAGDREHRFQCTVRIPNRARARYQKLLQDYSRRKDVPWTSDEEGLVKEIVKREPKFFEKAAPFIGYVQFLYEAQLPGGHRIKGLKFDMYWSVGGLHSLPKDPRTERNRDGVWRFKAP